MVYTHYTLGGCMKKRNMSFDIVFWLCVLVLLAIWVL